MSNQILNKTVREITREYSSTIPLFIKMNVDFYCEGTQTVKEVCDKINSDNFLHELNELLSSEDQSYPVEINQWPLDLLADYIEKTHHRYTEEILLKIKSGIESYLVSKEGTKSIVKDLQPIIIELAGEMGSHMKKEELILFPFIRKMVKSSGKLDPPRFTTVENPIEMMEHEHVTSRNLILKIRELTNNYALADDIDSELVYILTLIKSLDEDLIQHLHLENNILFPKAIVMEKRKVTS